MQKESSKDVFSDPPNIWKIIYCGDIMCGIVGAVAQRNVTSILLEGLRCREYRGYESVGLAVAHNGIIENHQSLTLATVE